VRILLDHCTPLPVSRLLPGHEVRTAYQIGWADLDNGNLLHAAEGEFDLFITTDRNIRHQQNLTGRKLAIVLIPQVLAVVRRHRDEFLSVVNSMKPGEYRELSWPD
jgi:hypothetical protein